MSFSTLKHPLYSIWLEFHPDISSSVVSKFRNLSRHKADEKFFLDHPRDSAWVASRDELLQRIKQKIDMERAWFRSFGRVTESTVVLICPKGQCPTKCSSLVLLCRF
jgi:hypothetical protein